MSGVKEQLIMTDGIVLFQKGVCVIVRDMENKEKCIWFKCIYPGKENKHGVMENGEINDYRESSPKDNVKYLARSLKFKETTDMSSSEFNPINAEAINLYVDGLCVEINGNNNIWFIDSSGAYILSEIGFNKIKQIYNDINMEPPTQAFGKLVSPLEDPETGGGSRKRKSTKKRRNTRRRNTRRKNTRRKNTKRKKTRRRR